MENSDLPDICLRARGLVKRYGGRPILNGIDFEVRAGEIVGLLGPNGAGKSTAFKIAMGLIAPDEGKIDFRGRDVTLLPTFQRARLGMGYLAQEPSIFRDLSVKENLECILQLQNRSLIEGNDRYILELLSELHLEHLADKRAETLSGGERRRLEITRAMMARPSLLLLDEPFANVDPITLQDLKKWLLHFSKRGIAILITDHNAIELLGLAHRNYVIGSGRVLAQGDRQVLTENQVVRERYLGTEFPRR